MERRQVIKMLREQRRFSSKGNKNAIKTGEYETIFADMLSDEEKDIYSNLNDDPFYFE